MKSKLEFESLRNRFDEDGFVIVRGLFADEEFRELQRQLERYVREVIPTLPKDAAYHDDYTKPETMRKMQSLDKHDAWFAQFMRLGQHVPLLEFFLRDKFSPQGIDWFDKLPYDTHATPAHQDGFYWCRRPNIACGLWIALDPVDRNNGCLWYARGSHKKGILPHVGSGVLGFSQGLQNFDPKAVDAVPIELAPGDAVAHSSSTIHWTEKNRTPRHRRAMATFCYGALTVLDEEAFARYKESLKAQLEKRGIAVAT
ncbi:MAG: phytanoyl-CoA dioxygenase family protein [Verrucomicrobia bacterium]|nr:phytanoyl-CoA dioxygenase family protein [Verrucomicrobiota bacterium]